MKVLLVSPYSNNNVGGIINWTKNILNYHKGHSMGVELCLLNNDKAVQVMAATNPIKRLVSGLRNYLPVYRSFRKLVSKESFDLVHICTSASFGLFRDLLLVREAKTMGIKTIAHMHFGRIPQLLAANGWEKFFFHRLMRLIDMAVVMDRPSLTALQDAGYENVCFLPNPLSPDVEQLIEKQGSVIREPRTLVYAGHIVETKGVFELVKACRDIPNIKLDMLGKANSERIREKIFNLGGENSGRWLSIPGNKPFDDVINAMLCCTVFVLPSYSEGFPNVILESMACGCAIVATKVGAIPEMLESEDGKNYGILIEPKNVNELKDAIVKMLDDEHLRMECGSNVKNRVYERYGLSNVWERLVNIWNDTKEK